MNQNEFDRFAKNYDATLAQVIPGGGDENAYFAEYKVALMAKHLGTAPKRILDYGCGIGRSLPWLAKYFPDAELWGFDLSKDCLHTASQCGVEAKLTSSWAAPTMGKFDLILAANVFHHIPWVERSGALMQCRDALASNGSFYLFEHNPWNPVTRWIFERCAFDVDAQMLSAREALELARGSGFDKITYGYTLFFPQSLKMLRPLEGGMHWLPLGAQYYVQMVR